MKKTITLLTMSLCSMMAFSQIAPELIVSKPVEVKKSTNQIAYGTEDDQGNTIVLMNNFEGGVRHMLKFDKYMKLLSNESLKTDRNRNPIDAIRVKKDKLQAFVDINDEFVVCDFNDKKFEIPKYKKYNFGNKTHSYTFSSPNSKFFAKAIRVGKAEKSNSDKRKFIIADLDWNLVESKIITSKASQEQMGMNRFLTQERSRRPIILDDATIIMESLSSKIKANDDENENTRKKRKKKKDIPGENTFYFIPANSEEASDMIYLGSKNRTVWNTMFTAKNDTLYALSLTSEYPKPEKINQKSFIQLVKIPFNSKDIYRSDEYPINFENNNINGISKFLVDDEGNAKFVLFYRDYGVYHKGHFHEGMVHEGFGDMIIGQIKNDLPDFYLIDRRMKVSLTQRVKGAGSRFDSGFFDFVNKDEELIVLLNIGEFKKIDNHLFIANFLDKESQKYRDKKGFNRQLENIKTQAYIFKLGNDGLEYEAIKKTYDNNLAFERAYLNEKGEVIVSTGEYDSKQFVKMKF